MGGGRERYILLPNLASCRHMRQHGSRSYTRKGHSKAAKGAAEDLRCVKGAEHNNFTRGLAEEG